MEDGLPVNAITTLLQSRSGYLWAATFDGLVRFDGVRFTVYHAGNTEGLPSSRIIALGEGSDGTLWLRTAQNHLVRFRDGAFTHFGADAGLSAAALTFWVDPVGTVWVGTDQGLGRIRGDRFEPLLPDGIRNAVTEITSGRDGTVWAGTARAELFRVRGDSVRTIAGLDGPIAGSIVALREDRTGTLWIGTATGGFRYDGSGITRILVNGAPWVEPVNEFLEDPSGSFMWIRAASGIFRWTSGTLTPEIDERHVITRGPLLRAQGRSVWAVARTSIYRDGILEFTLPDGGGPAPANEIRGVLLDHEGSIWLATSAGGLHRLKPALFTVRSKPEGLPHENVYPILEDRSGLIWMGTWGGGLGLMRDGHPIGLAPDAGYPSFILSLLEDRRGRIWMGALDNGVWLCQAAGPSCSSAALPPVRYRDVYAMHEDAAGTIWLGTDQGLFRREGDEWSPVAGGPTAYVQVFRDTRDGALWMGTSGSGLVRYANGRFTSIGTPHGLPSDVIRSLYQDADGWLWIGTEGRGLARIDPTAWASDTAGAAARTITSIRARDGLFDEVIHQILEDAQGRLWMSTNRGIFWVRRTQLDAFARGEVARVRSTAYTERDGLRNREANGGFQPAGMRASDGRLWFPTQDGAVIVDPSRLTRNEVPPSVVIEEIVTAGRRLRVGDTTAVLDASERDVEIVYTALSFMAPENVRFRYRLEGYDDDWVEAGNRRSAFYTRVPPGDYAFRVIASNNEDVWNEVGASMAMTIAPRFYETRAWYVFVALTLGLLSVAAVRWRERRLHARQHELAQLVNARTAQLRSHEAQLEAQNAQLEAQATRLAELDRAKSRFFANLSHEFRTPLTLTIGPLEDLRGWLRDRLEGDPPRQLDMALRNSRRLLRLVNQVLDVAKLESGKMRIRAREGDVVAFVRSLAAAFTPVAERRRIAYRLPAPGTAIPCWFDPDALEKVLANLLSNAFKFTPDDGTIEVRVEREPGDGGVRIAVSDTGPGIPEADLKHVFERFFQSGTWHQRAQAGTGIGLSLARELVELHGGRIVVESPAGAGATFIVHMPFGRDHLDDDQIAEAEPAGAVVTPVAAMEDASDTRSGAAAEDGRGDESDVTTVLIIDDSADVRAYIRERLEQSYRVIEADNGSEGLDLAVALLPDLIISDVVMPGMDGHELCRALRARRETDFLPVILLTGKAATEDRVAGLDTGADDYIVKPFEMRELEARVANLIASRRRLQERFAGKVEIHARPVEVTSEDEAYIERVRSIIEANLADASFGVAGLANRLGQDRSHTYRRIRALIGETPTDLIRRLRLERATQLLEGRAGTIAEIAYAVGFNSVSYFSRSFRELHGVPPSSWSVDPPG